MKAKIKIAHLQLLPLLSGVQRSMLDFLLRLDRKRYDITVICKEEGDLTQALRRAEIRFHIIPSLQRPIHPVADMKALRALYRLFRRDKYDVIHTHSSKTGLLGRLAGRLAGVPHIFHTVHGLPFHEFSGKSKTWIYSLIERWAGRFSDKVVFVNNEERELMVRKGLLSSGQVVTIYNGVDLHKVAQWNTAANRVAFRKHYAIPEQSFVVAFVGRLWEQKDPQTLAQIIDRCQDLPVTFLIVGDGPYLESFRQTYRPPSRVIMTGWLEECYRMYPAIDVLVLPSLWEGLSVTLIEAMAFGKPLIASNIKGNRECVHPGENGFLCTPKVAEEFRHAIKTLLENKDVYEHMSLRAIDIAHHDFDLQRNSEQLIRLYERQLSHV
jgi:glycosyltransferase involved in cell wall biosynthesis